MKAIKLRYLLILLMVILIQFTSFATIRDTTKVYQDPFPWIKFYQELKRSIGYPESAIESKVQGYVQIKFRIKSDGAKDLSIVGKPLGYGLDESVIKALSELDGYQDLPNGKYSIVVAFEITGLADYGPAPEKVEGYQPLNLITKSINQYRFKPKIDKSIVEGDKIFDFVGIDTPPSFPGGSKAFTNYLKKEINYSGDAKGKVFLSAVIEKDGSITDIRVDRRLGSGADEEAIRLLKNSPKWMPGVQWGKPVRVKYNIPISFNM